MPSAINDGKDYGLDFFIALSQDVSIYKIKRKIIFSSTCWLTFIHLYSRKAFVNLNVCLSNLLHILQLVKRHAMLLKIFCQSLENVGFTK